MFSWLSLTGALCLLKALHTFADIDGGTFLIFNQNHNKCVKVVSASSITLDQCRPHAKEQQFRWASESRLLSLSLKLCLGAVEIKDWVKVLLFECDEKSDLQHWQCKNETLFGLKDQDLHLNWGNNGEKNLMIYKGAGVWSRWRIFGTMGDLCSKGFQETFTVGGNAFGARCQFPFKFNKIWYAECTRDGRSDKLLWCATERDYDETRRWGFCATAGTTGWDTDAITGAQYQRNPQAALTWHQARKSCQQQGADLLSIMELHEQSYISGLMNSFGTSVWIGLNSLDFESGWQWSNGNPFRYLNWAPGHPSSDPGLSCATLNAAKASKWESENCNKKLGYICRKGNSTRLPLPLVTGPSFCPSHWVPYGGNCYYLERTKRMWKDALAACRKEEANLASILNIEEQSFIISQSGYRETDVLWIGLNDQKLQMLFEWSDHSYVTFTNWQNGEPSYDTNFQEDCVLIRGKDGKWADHLCEKAYGYICKKTGSTKPSDGTQEEVNPGCKLGSIRFASHCYVIGAEKKTFEEAKKSCSAEGANLVDVANRYENAFLVSLVGLRPEKYFWTGFSNTEDRNNFEWTTKREVTFTHFNVGMPDRKQGCVAMTTGTFAGLWDVVSCSNKEKYICKKRAEGAPMSTVPPTTPTLSCASGWTPITQRNICYKVYKDMNDHKRTWFEAQNFCKAIGGDLMSIHSRFDFENLRLFSSSAVWVGLKLKGPNQGFAWSDGSPFGYEHWGYGEPNNYNDNEHCVEVNAYYDQHWNDRSCDVYNDWICQINKGVIPKPEPTRVVEVYNTTDDGWLIYNDSHYYINQENLPMDAARDYCRKNFGDLVVITGETERKFLWKQIIKQSKAQYYIGMTINLDKSFSWLDGTAVTYTAWEHNEPNFANNEEFCVTIYKSMGFWNDVNCGIELPSICKRSSYFVNTTMAPTTAPKGGCAPQWLTFQGKCYKFFMERKNWEDARSHCQKEGGNLVSISSEKEQAFLTTQLLSNNEDIWIGMNDINQEMRFVWTDGKGTSYTNWGKGQPVSSPSRQYLMVEIFDCVVMAGEIIRMKGQWKVENCDLKRGFICKRHVDPQIAVPPTTVTPKAYYKIGNDSYKLVAQKMKWDEARRHCLADDADLASILDPVIQASVSLHIYKEPVWIGLNSNVTFGRFKWVDNWVFAYTKWGENEPKLNYGCVYIDVDHTWKTAPCTNMYYSFCKKSSAVAPTEPPQLPGTCPESKEQMTWIPFRGHCYSFQSSSLRTWPHATVECLRMGASLTSVQDPAEEMFIQQTIELLQDVGNFWIGLYKSHNGEWNWIDNSVLDYTNWKTGMPKSETCVYINSESGQWITNGCSRFRPFICKMPKTIQPTEKPVKDAQKIEASQGSAGITVAIVLIVIAIVGLSAFLMFRNRIRLIPSALVEATFDNKLYFNNPNRGQVDTKGLVANIEQNEQA